jgi:type VI protein secretion system component Hcp
MKAYQITCAWFRRRLILLACLALLTPEPSRAGEWFLKIDGVRGELTEGRFAGWTAVKSAGALVSLPGTNTPSGQASFSCEVWKAFDGISPALLQRCGDGASFGRVTLACMVSQPQPVLHRITMENAFVSSVVHAGARSSSETNECERTSLNFQKIEFTTIGMHDNGGANGGLTARFDGAVGTGDLRTRPPLRVTASRDSGRPGMWLTWLAERGHHYVVRVGGSNGGIWKTTDFPTPEVDGPVRHFLSGAEADLLMRVEEVD